MFSSLPQIFNRLSRVKRLKFRFFFTILNVTAINSHNMIHKSGSSYGIIFYCPSNAELNLSITWYYIAFAPSTSKQVQIPASPKDDNQTGIYIRPSYVLIFNSKL